MLAQMSEDFAQGPASADKSTKTVRVLTRIVLAIWLLLLIPSLPGFLASGLAFDSGSTWRAYTFAISLLTFPISICVTVVLRAYGKNRAFVLLPLLNVAAFLISGR